MTVVCSAYFSLIEAFNRVSCFFHFVSGLVFLETTSCLGDTMTFMAGLLQWTTCFIMFHTGCVIGCVFVQHAVAHRVQAS